MDTLIFIAGVAALLFFHIYPPTQQAKKPRIQKLGQKARKEISDLTNAFMREMIKNKDKKEKKE